MEVELLLKTGYYNTTLQNECIRQLGYPDEKVIRSGRGGPLVLRR